VLEVVVQIRDGLSESLRERFGRAQVLERWRAMQAG
jgi:hypothetical protein